VDHGGPTAQGAGTSPCRGLFVSLRKVRAVCDTASRGRRPSRHNRATCRAGFGKAYAR